MVSDKKEPPKLNPNKPKKRSVKDIVIKKFDTSKSVNDSELEFENKNEKEEDGPQTNEEKVETKIEDFEKEKSSEDNKEDVKEVSSINPIDSVKGVIKKFESEPAPSKPTLNPSPNDLKTKETVNPIKEVIKITESEVKSASDTTIDSVKGVINKLESDSAPSKPTLNPSPNDLPKTWQKMKEEPSEDTDDSEKDESEVKTKTEEIEEYDDSEIPKDIKFSSNIMESRITVFKYKIKIVDVVIVFLGLFLILCGVFASAGVAEKLVDNVVFGERSTISFLLVIIGILLIAAVLGPMLIKRSVFKGFYEQLQSVDAEPDENPNSKKSDSEDKDKNEDSKDDESEGINN